MREWMIYGVGIVAVVVLYVLNLKDKIDHRIFAEAVELIPEAEKVFLDQEKSGAEKKEWVIRQITEILPGIFRKIFSNDTIGGVVQYVFDRIERFSRVK